MYGATNLEDVIVGPASSTNNAIVRWNGTTGNSIQNLTVLLSDMNVFIILGQTLLYADTTQSNFLVSKTSLGTIIGSNNTLVGIDAGTTISSANNTGLGYGVLANISFGSSNIAIGNAASSSYIATKTSNICIGAMGTAGEDTTIRIGPSQTTCYIKGIYGVSSRAQHKQ
jgi:hypothetical protein